MENPGSFNENILQYPELTDGEVLKLYEKSLLRWKLYCQERNQDVIELPLEPRELA